jgi:DNA-binding FrmR family transcriptional regulator
VRSALDRVEEEILRDHVSTCIEHAISSGNKADQRRKVAELIEVFGRTKR